MLINRQDQDRNAAQFKFPLGCRMVYKVTGEVYIRGARKNKRECWVMLLNPGRRYLVTWTGLLERFELASI